MPEKQKLKIDDIKKLKITKVKDWAIYFTYNNERYILHESSEDYETYTTLYKKEQLDKPDKFKLRWICNECGRNIPYICYSSKKRIKHPNSRPNSQIDLNQFLWDMTWNEFFDSCYSDEIIKRKQQIKDIDQAISVLNNQKQELRKIR